MQHFSAKVARTPITSTKNSVNRRVLHKHVNNITTNLINMSNMFTKKGRIRNASNLARFGVSQTKLRNMFWIAKARYGSAHFATITTAPNNADIMYDIMYTAFTVVKAQNFAANQHPRNAILETSNTILKMPESNWTVHIQIFVGSFFSPCSHFYRGYCLGTRTFFNDSHSTTPTGAN
jgi:hypothetical protein